jgi:uncharacterized membrane protein
MDQIASNVLTIMIEKNTIFTIFKNLPLYYVFLAPLSVWDFFQLSSTCPVHLKMNSHAYIHGHCSGQVLYFIQDEYAIKSQENNY